MLYYDSNNPQGGAFAAPQIGRAEDPITEAEWAALQPETVAKNSDGFRQWRRQNAEYRAWRAANVADVMALEFDIDKGDLGSALITWNLIKVAPEMQTLLVNKLSEFGFVDVVAKLNSSPS